MILSTILVRRIVLKNINALDFDGETGELHVQGENGKVIKYRIVKEVQVL